jgi:hypothetical protein
MPTRKQWFFCPHWERFLIRGSQSCLICEPPRQIQSTQPMRTPQRRKTRALRSIFPILNDHGEPLGSQESPLAS